MNARHAIRIMMLFVAAVLTTGSSIAAPKPEDEAKKSAELWLALVDSGKYGESWKTAAIYFQTAIKQEQWEQSLSAVRKPLGDLVSREFKSAKYTKSVPGAPDGEYVIIQFTTSFANKKEAVETITPMLDKSGEWKVSGYFIK